MSEATSTAECAEGRRLREDAQREHNWKRWGPYLAGRQWGTVREDYSRNGDCWNYFSHEDAVSRAYRWGEDGLLGICDRECRLCFSVALWNGSDPILKERFFGLTNAEGNHGEDVKECYFHLDNTPTHSWMRALYKYPQEPFPYDALRKENRRRGRDKPEYELADTGVFDAGRYWDVELAYAKGGPNDILIQITATNRGSESATLHVLPTWWMRNTWDWNEPVAQGLGKPVIHMDDEEGAVAEHPTLGRFFLEADETDSVEWLFTENESNTELLFGAPNRTPFVKDAFHAHVVHGRKGVVNPAGTGTKCTVHGQWRLAGGASKTWRLRMTLEGERNGAPFGPGYDKIWEARRREAAAFHATMERKGRRLSAEERAVATQARSGLLWSKQYYEYVIADWLKGDAAQPPPPLERKFGRNHDWEHLYARDVLSMPDKWEYPWFAAWDLAFHMIPLAKLDPDLAKQQLNLLLREWYLHPNGQMPAYEFALGDVNPPVHAWACWRVYKCTGKRGQRDRVFLARVFQKLLLNFTWWVNRKDPQGNHLFSGGFLGLDNIGVFDRSKPLPGGGELEQADGTAWMAFYCGTMLSIALELAREDPAYEDIASKFFVHFIAIADAMNRIGDEGLWHEEDGFYYDQLRINGESVPLRLRSIVGLIPLFAVEVLEDEAIEQLPGFAKRLRWFLDNRPELARHMVCMSKRGGTSGRRLVAIPSRERLERVLRYAFDEAEFLSPYGVRSVSKHHDTQPYVFDWHGHRHEVRYQPGESDSGLFGGNSNWRGPVWFPLNYLLIEALERYHHFYGDGFQMEFPSGSGVRLNLREIAEELARRLISLFLPDAKGRRPAMGEMERFTSDPHWKDLLWFHEYFHGETGQGLGASHQTGWTAMVAKMIEDYGSKS